MDYRSHGTADPDGGTAHPQFSVRVVAPSHASMRRQPRRKRLLLPVIGIDDVILPAFDDTLADMAIRAQLGDQEARDALYAAFLPKLTRLMSAVRPPSAPDGSEGIWSQDDVAQEAYLVFIELIEAWTGDVSFTAYVLSRFPWRLKDAVRRGIGKRSVPPRMFCVPIEQAALVTDGEDYDAAATALLDSIVELLPEPLGTILVAHVVYGKTRIEIAGELGVSRRTMVRYWNEIRIRAERIVAQELRHDTGA